MLLGTVVAFSVLPACSMLLSTHGWVCARGGEETQIHYRKYNVIRTIDAKVSNPNGPNILVQNGYAAHNSSKRQVIDYIYEAGPEKIN